jgi:aryl-alcohol dehydrogenase-like predicted oxidoreductase
LAVPAEDWVGAHPAVITPVFGVRIVEKLRDSLAAQNIREYAGAAR